MDHQVHIDFHHVLQRIVREADVGILFWSVDVVKELLVSESLLYAAALQAACHGPVSPCWLLWCKTRIISI